jgi:myo-inositol catabolism protein IolC
VRVYLLAADHRWPWEEWCDGRAIPRTRFAEVKRLAVAIGRSVFWEPSTAFLDGTRSADQAAAEICADYLRLVDAWRR